jgi:hypothetical protein
VLAYEDRPAGYYAKEFIDRLVPGDEAHIQLCKFDGLRLPVLFNEMAVAATNADLILFATHDHGELPPEARSWVARWVADRPSDRPGALVALCANPEVAPPGPSLLHSYLQAIARLTGMDFLGGNAATA